MTLVKKLAALAVLTTALCVPASAQPRTIFVTGHELQATCESNPERCLGYVTAMADTFESFARPMPRTCRTQAVGLQEVVDFALATLADERTDLERPAINILGDAFSQKWPC